MKLAIITGGSKGLGKALVVGFSKIDFHVISISRSSGNFDKTFSVEEYRCDLAIETDITALQRHLSTRFEHLNPSEVVLVNNAGTLGTIRSIDKNENEDISQTIALNLTSPLLLSAFLIGHFKSSAVKTSSYFVSSGAAVKPYSGWATYCATKAGLEMAGKVIALEQKGNQHFQLLNLNPGVMDTDMQAQIRRSEENDFPQLARFQQLKENKELASPTEIAEKIVQLALGNNYESGDTVVLREIIKY